MSYQKFLESKILTTEDNGFECKEFHPSLFEHQKECIEWALLGGRRALFINFGLGKTVCQLEIGIKVIEKTNKPFLICLPLGVKGEFKRDAKKILGYSVEYVTDSNECKENKIYLTNYDRVRMGNFDADLFGGVSFDEASILRNLSTKTVDYVLKNFRNIQYRFICTATPTPNDYIEILNYADYLGIIDRGQALTRFFQRDSTQAGHLTLYPHKEDEFWMWVSTWALFITKPSDLGYDDTGYILPPMDVQDHIVSYKRDIETDDHGNIKIFNDNVKSLSKAAYEKRHSIEARCNKAIEIADSKPDSNIVFWVHLEDERRCLESILQGKNYVSIFGSQPDDIKEKYTIDFSEGKYQYLITKPSISGSGCNFQNVCHISINVGIDYKFNDYIQSIHRFYRFNQKNQVQVHNIFTDLEIEIKKALYKKWKKHDAMQVKMVSIIKKYGLNKSGMTSDLKRTIGVKRLEYNGSNYQLVRNDTVYETANMETDSVGLIVTSIPFGDHYEYSPSYNDFGHNYGNELFYSQMDFLTPELLRVLQPGRIAAIHVKDRIRYSYQNGTSFTTIDDFSGDCVRHFKSHGFHLIGKITITTDVVRENNQTYRLGWSEQCKDASKMGVGLPEYVLLFRKSPSENDNAYADDRVSKTKKDYTRANWQLDAHAYHRSNGNRFLTPEELKTYGFKTIINKWKEYNQKNIYDFLKHLQACEELEDAGKLSATFMTLPTHSNNDFVWTDVNRMHTLNSKQTQKRQQKHICPLQFDIVDRLVTRYSNKEDLVYDPFGGLFTVPYRCIKLGRRSKSTELNEEYFLDGVAYCKSMEYEINMPTLFSMESI